MHTDINTPASTHIAPDKIRALRSRMSAAGITVAELASEIGVSRMTLVQLLAGRSKGVRGAAHEAAVRLGLKPGGIIRTERSSIVDIAKGTAHV